MPEAPESQLEPPETNPNRLLEQKAVVGLLRTAFVVRRRLEAEMHRFGITGQQYNVLRILRGEGKPLPTMDLAARMIEPEPGITRMARRLERKGLIRRTASETDARRVLCTVTKKGLTVLGQLDDPVTQTNHEIMGALDPVGMATLIRLLDEIESEAAPKRPLA